MSGTDLAVIDQYARASLDERQRYATMIAGAGALLSQSVRNQGAPGVFLMAETGAMLGIHPVAALQGVHVIDGKPTLSANLLSALVRRAGHKIRVTTTGAWGNGTFVARAVLIRVDQAARRGRRPAGQAGPMAAVPRVDGQGSSHHRGHPRGSV
jgi:hypothetical protein